MTLHRNGRNPEPLEIASLAEIETEVADILDVMHRVAAEEARADDALVQLGGPLFQIAEAVRGLAWTVGSLAKHHEELAVATKMGEPT